MRRENINEAKFNTNDLLDSIESAYKKGGLKGAIQGGKEFGLTDRTTVDELLDSAKSVFGADLKKAAAEIKGFLKPQDYAKYKTKMESAQMDRENINEKVNIDGRTRIYRETVARLDTARKLREQRLKSMKENRFNGLYDDGSGKGAVIPQPIDFEFSEAMKMVEKYREMREKKKTLMGNAKKESSQQTEEEVEVIDELLTPMRDAITARERDKATADYNNPNLSAAQQKKANARASRATYARLRARSNDGTVAGKAQTPKFKRENEKWRKAEKSVKEESIEIAGEILDEASDMMLRSWIRNNYPKADNAKFNKILTAMSRQYAKDPKGYTYGGGFSKVAKDAKIKEQIEESNSVESAIQMKGEKYVMDEAELSPDQKKYRAFFDKTLKKFGASSPAKMDDAKKKKFFDYIKANWKG